MNYRRAKTAGGTYFFTVVTHNRRPFLCIPENIALLRQAFRYAMGHRPRLLADGTSPWAIGRTLI